MRRKFERERRIAAFRLAEPDAIDPHSRSRHNAFKVHENAVPFRAARNFEAPPVQGNELIFLLIEAVPGQTLIRVRHNDAFKASVVEVLVMSAFDRLWADLHSRLMGRIVLPAAPSVPGVSPNA